MMSCVVVLGMHRSGTSALAGVLSGMGVDFGLEENLIGGQSEVNARGFWEHREIVMLNEQLLTTLGSSWDDIREIDVKLFETEEVCEIKEEIKMLLVRDFSGSSLWGLKDPRICKLLPLWIDIFKEIGVAPQFIIAYRHPEEVARSLEKRDGFSIEKAYSLWLSYVLLSEEFSSGFPRTFIAYDSLLDNWRKTMEKAFSDLSLPFDNNLINSNEIDSFLSPSLRHMVSEKESLNEQRSAWVQKLYRALLHYSDGASDDPIIRYDISQLRSNIQIAMGLFGPMLFDQQSACSETGKLRRELSSLITDYEQTREAYEQTKEAYEQTREAYEQTREAYEQTKEAYEQTREAYEQTKEAYEQIKEGYEQTKEELELIKDKFSWKICNKLGL